MTPLSEEQLWWRANDASNSAGNLVLHLAGNVGQWIVHGLGGHADVRDRASEFECGGGMSPEAVLEHLDGTLGRVDAVLAELDPEQLILPVTVQGIETDGLRALYHSVEHFSMHTGQILFIAKQLTGRDLGFYRVDEQGRVTGTRW